MQRLPLKLAASGMVLAKEASTEDGRVLCGPGTELTAEIIDRLARSGISAVSVEGHPVKLPGEKSLSQRIKDLDARFAKVKDDAVLNALMKLIAEHWIEKEKGTDKTGNG